jgi:molybdopterin-guanine dinucleotide biosynthesis protein A
MPSLVSSNEQTLAGLAGVVFAGGYSRRMGRDKATLRLKGKLLWRRQVAVLRAAGADPVWIGRRSDQTKLGRGARVLFDELSDIGPIAGLHSALKSIEASWVAVLAVDMPAIEADWFAKLFAQCSDGVGAVARHADGFEPLAAIYPEEAFEIVSRRVKAKKFSLQDAVKALVRGKRMRVVRLPESERWRVANWNKPAPQLSTAWAVV